MKQILAKIRQDKFFFKTEEDEALFKTTVPENLVKPPCWRAWDYLLKQGWIGGSEDAANGGFIVWQQPETDAEELELCLKQHDWSYEWSDAMNTWRKGEAEKDRIKRLMKRIGNPQAVEIYKKFCPSVDDFKWGLR